MIKKATLLSILLLMTGCVGLDLSKESWSKLSDRKFHLSEFKYIHPGKDTKYALDTMKEFPTKKLMYIISRNYNVEIDMSDFQLFLNRRRETEIKTHGFFRTTSFTWSSDNKNYNNTIKIIFERDYMDESQMKYKMIAESGGGMLKSFEIKFTRFEILFNQMKYYFTDTEKFIAEFDNNSYKDSEKVPGLIFGTIPTIQVTDESKKDQIKSLLDEYVKDLDEEQKKSFKHEIIDHIYKICE